MNSQYPLFSQVALAQDIPAHNLKRGAIATIAERYPMPEGELIPKLEALLRGRASQRLDDPIA